MEKTTSLSVIVPVFNEQYLVESSLRRLQALAESPHLHRVQVIVVDDGSEDHSQDSIQKFQQTLISHSCGGKMQWVFLRHEKNRGKGAAIQSGIEKANCEITVFHDADLEYHPLDLLRMISLFLQEDADAVYGSRFLAAGHKRALFFRHTLGNRFLTFCCDLVCDLNLTDMETCYKMVRTDLLKSIPIVSSDYRIEPEITIKLAKRGAHIFEVPISYSGRTYEEGKKINWKDGFRALGAILRFWVSDRIYLRDQYGSEILGRMNRAPRYNRWMSDVIRPYVGDRVLEIGAGVGNLTLHLLPRSKYWVSDVNPLYLDSLRRLCKARPYLQVIFANVVDRDSFPPNQRFDTVVCLNVLEHVEDDVGALRNIHEVLEEEGRAIILVPNGPRLFGSLDEVLGHRRRYRREGIAEVGKLAGFQVERVLGFNRGGAPAWWFNGRVLRRKAFGLPQIKILNLLTPAFRRLDRWLPLPPLSWIAVFRKRAPSSGDL